MSRAQASQISREQGLELLAMVRRGVNCQVRLLLHIDKARISNTGNCRDMAHCLRQGDRLVLVGRIVQLVVKIGGNRRIEIGGVQSSQLLLSHDLMQFLWLLNVLDIVELIEMFLCASQAGHPAGNTVWRRAI